VTERDRLGERRIKKRDKEKKEDLSWIKVSLSYYPICENHEFWWSCGMFIINYSHHIFWFTCGIRAHGWLNLWFSNYEFFPILINPKFKLGISDWMGTYCFFESHNIFLSFNVCELQCPLFKEEFFIHALPIANLHEFWA